MSSLRAQEDPAWEAVIVDDGSSDRSWELLEQAGREDARIRVFRRRGEPKGAGTCRNEAVEQARADLLVFLDTDDLAAPHCTAQRSREMERRPADEFVIFPVTVFRGQPGPGDRRWAEEDGRPLLLRQFHQKGICQTTGPAFRREPFRRAGGWDASLAIWQDIDLFFRMFIPGRPHSLAMDLPPDVHLREHDESLSRGDPFSPAKQASKARVIRKAIRLLEETGRKEWLCEARHITAEVVHGFARTRRAEPGRDLVSFAEERGVLDAGEAGFLRRLLLAHQLRLPRLPGVGPRLEKAFRKKFEKKPEGNRILNPT